MSHYVTYWTSDPTPDADYTTRDDAWQHAMDVVMARFRACLAKRGYRPFGLATIAEVPGGMIVVDCETAVSWRAA